jgi:anaerobic magnesium-protoporphyrin IX monomethyl ester cyclase
LVRALLVQSPAVSPWLSHGEWEPPSISLATIAGQIDRHDVRVADLVVWRKRAKQRLLRVLERFRPRVVGFSSMTFQYDSTLRFAYLAKQFDPDIYTVLGGYHASLCFEQIADGPDAQFWDALIRGEGDLSFGELLDCLEARGQGLDRVLGLSYRAAGKFHHNPPRPLEDLAKLRIPARHKRLARGFHMYFRRADVVETSRGCLYGCNFCSIRSMYGKTFRVFPLDRVAADVQDAYRRGARHIFITDDNITMDMDRFEQLCDRIIELRLKGLKFTTQASPIGFARRPAVVKKMVEAGIVSIFLGIENVSPNNLRLMRKPNTVELIRQGVRAVQRDGGIAVAGIINGLPHDDLESLRHNLEFVRSLGITSIMDQLMTPYPSTPIRQQMLEQGCVSNPSDFRWYDGYFANAATDTLSPAELSYARWRLRREIIGMWRPTRGDWQHFKDYTCLWLLGLKYVVWLNERLLEFLYGVEGRYKLQMRYYLRLNDFGIDIPGYRRPVTYHPVWGDQSDPFAESRSALLNTKLDLAAVKSLRGHDAKRILPDRTDGAEAPATPGAH